MNSCMFSDLVGTWVGWRSPGRLGTARCGGTWCLHAASRSVRSPGWWSGTARPYSGDKRDGTTLLWRQGTPLLWREGRRPLLPWRPGRRDAVTLETKGTGHGYSGDGTLLLWRWDSVTLETRKTGQCNSGDETPLPWRQGRRDTVTMETREKGQCNSGHGTLSLWRRGAAALETRGPGNTCSHFILISVLARNLHDAVMRQVRPRRENTHFTLCSSMLSWWPYHPIGHVLLCCHGDSSIL